jgi:hypothetical protein
VRAAAIGIVVGRVGTAQPRGEAGQILRVLLEQPMQRCGLLLQPSVLAAALLAVAQPRPFPARLGRKFGCAHCQFARCGFAQCCGAVTGARPDVQRIRHM